MRANGDRYDVGGVLLRAAVQDPAPGSLRLQRRQHGRRAGRFYTDLLGLQSLGHARLRRHAVGPQGARTSAIPRGFFMRYGTDHHAFVLFNKRVMRPAAGPADSRPRSRSTRSPGRSAASGRSATRAHLLQGAGRAASSASAATCRARNWHAYVYDPDGHTNELYYGIEQIGWDGYSKPRAMYDRGFRETPALPQMSELDEVGRRPQARASTSPRATATWRRCPRRTTSTASCCRGRSRSPRSAR